MADSFAESDVASTPRTRSILVHEGKRARRQSTAQFTHFSEKQETFTIPEPSPDELPEFYDEEERIRAVASAKELAEEALTDDSDDRVDRASAPCFACCAGPSETTTADSAIDEDVQLTEEVIEKMSTKQLNNLIERRLSRELSRGETLTKEESFRVDKGIVSFGTFLVSKSKAPSRILSQPVPLVDYLPPSPLFTFDGKLGVNCMAFKLDFTDKLANIVPPFFLGDEDQLDERARNILKKGVSYARAIDMFGPQDLNFISQGEEPSAAHKDLLSC